jgi:predicted MPP superfamily phosphohydrolase
MKGQAPLWANLKHHFYDDLRLLHRQSGPWDLLIFSGDIVQKGDAEEFRGATAALQELYGKLADLNCSPKFIAVPGNHDLVRPDANDMSAMLLQDWPKKHNVRDDFLNNPAGSYRETIRSAFANYQAWYEGLRGAGIPVIDAAHGFLPGDQVFTLVKDEKQLGLVGLNSTWLQLSKENKAGDLHVDHQQLSRMLPDAEGWCRANDFNLLVTHQPVEWLSLGSLETWKKEIAPPGRFDLHLFGHMHEPLSSSLSQMGSSPVTIFQSPSLFGLEHFGDGRTERIHGYSAGALVINEKGRQLRIWPRTYQVTRSGQGRVTPNFEFILPDNESTVTQLPDKQVTKSAGAVVVNSVLPIAQAEREEAFVATASTEKTDLLSRFRHHLLPPGPHAFVRKEEQNIAANALAKRGLWIIADWGLGSDEFVSSVLQSVRCRTGRCSGST